MMIWKQLLSSSIWSLHWDKSDQIWLTCKICKKKMPYTCQAIHEVWTECCQILQIFQTNIRFYSLKNSQLPSCHWCFVGRKCVRFKSSAWNTKSSSLPSSFHCLDFTPLCIIAALRSKCLKRAPSLRSFLSSSSFYRDRIFRSSFYKRNVCQSIKCLNLLHRVEAHKLQNFDSSFLR